MFFVGSCHSMTSAMHWLSVGIAGKYAYGLNGAAITLAMA